MSEKYPHDIDQHFRDRIAQLQAGNRWLRLELSITQQRLAKALAGQPRGELLDDITARAKCFRISDEIHNLACERQSEEDLALRLEGLSSRLLDLGRILSPNPAQRGAK